MKKKYVLMIAAGLCMAFLIGCGKKSDESIVKKKSADNVKSYESMEDDRKDTEDDGKGTEEKEDDPLRKLLGAPEHYTNHASYQDGELVVDTDADIILPEVSSINTYAVSAKKFNQEMVDTVSNAFLENANIYSTRTYVDPYGTVSSENGAVLPDIHAVNEERFRFGGVAEAADGNYDIDIEYVAPPETAFNLYRHKKDLVTDSQEYKNWRDASSLLDVEENGEIRLTEDDVKEFLDVSVEDAQKVAEEKVEKLGWGLELYGWEYAVFHRSGGEVKRDNVSDAGYLFHFTRKQDGIPVTYTESYGGSVEDMESTWDPWSYERCDVIVGGDGIQMVKILCPYDVGDIQTENVKLMDFESIIKIYEQMMEVSNTDALKYVKNRTYHIRRITLGYSRVYDPKADDDAGLLVPVWDFFGGYDSESDSEEIKNNGEYSNRSFMTINAIDGTIINRELGY